MDDLASWHDFYVMLGTAAAALTGLVVVAMSLHLRAIAQNAVHRGLARGSLISLVAILVICAVGLLPGPMSTFGLEVVVLSAALAAYNVLLVVRATRLPGAWGLRRVLRATLYILSPLACGVAGALMVIGTAFAPYLLAVTLIVPLVLDVTNAWSLLLDISDEDGDTA